MKEIGGYVELDTYNLPMLHDGAIALNCGRNALAYLLRARKIKCLWIPKFICDSVTNICEREGVPYKLYGIGLDLKPRENIKLNNDEWLYFVNYYSQFDNDCILEYVRKYKRVIVDNVQSYFQMPILGVDTIYTCRKYFGVPDGAFLYTDSYLHEELSVDESYQQMSHILGRYEKTATEFYSIYLESEKAFANRPLMKMSRLTKNLLHAIDYKEVVRKRRINYEYIHTHLGHINRLKPYDGLFMYPFLTENGAYIRDRLRKKNIYIPILWPTVFELSKKGDPEYLMAENIIPLPIDQRYGRTEMNIIIEELMQCIN